MLARSIHVQKRHHGPATALPPPHILLACDAHIVPAAGLETEQLLVKSLGTACYAMTVSILEKRNILRFFFFLPYSNVMSVQV